MVKNLIFLLLLVLQGCSVNAVKQASIAQQSNIPDKTSHSQQHNKIKIALDSKSWAKAKQLIQQAIAEYPQESKFHTQLADLAIKQSESLRRLETREAISQGYWLKSQTALVKHQKSASGFKWFNNIRLFQLNLKRQSLQEQLMLLAYQALSGKDLQGARDCITLLQLLDADFNSNEEYLSLQNSLVDVGQEKTQRQTQRIITELHQALNNKDYSQAVNLVTRLQTPLNTKNQQLVDQAKIIFEKQALLLGKQGDSIYRQGKITLALEKWREAKKLLPNEPALDEKIARAIKVKNKLKKLRKTNQTN